MYQTKNLGLNVTEIEKDKLMPWSFHNDLGHNFESIDEKTLSHRNITNCLLEVPQDIKLELVDGVLTLKEGSKVYIPKGFEADGITKKFDEVVINSDLTKTDLPNITSRVMFFVREDGKYLHSVNSSNVASGTDETGEFFYNISINKLYSTSETTTLHSFPIAIATIVNGVPTSIDQVFNGFGYIGSTVFALPGVKGLCTNGRNTDLTLKHTNLTVSKVILGDWGAEGSNGSAYCIIKSNNTMGKSTAGFELSKNGNLFDKSVGNAIQGFVFAKIESTNGTIKNLNPYYPFRAVDFNDYQTKITELETKIATLEAAVEALQG